MPAGFVAFVKVNFDFRVIEFSLISELQAQCIAMVASRALLWVN